MLFVFYIAVALVLGWLGVGLLNRVRQLEMRTYDAERRAAELTQRVFQLEEALRRGDRAAPPEAPPAAAQHYAPSPVAMPWNQGPVSPPPVPAGPPPDRQAAPPPVPPPLPQTVGEEGRGDKLEELIGGNWLSKAGVFVLLIGLALMLGYSLVSLGPEGKIATATAASVVLLGAGVFAEKKTGYEMLGRALLGGGWAGLYLTAYAAHGIDAARVIDNPGAGFLVLLVVAGGMIVHSLRYKSQTVTGLAFMAAYVSIAISSLTKFSAIASIPLLLALLGLAWRFGWGRLAAAGAVFTYAAYGFDLATGDKDRYFLAFGEPVLWAYWVILEVYDLAALRRHGSEKESGYFPVGPFNLCGFFMATAAVWPRSGWSPEFMYGAMTAGQVISAGLRGRRGADGDWDDRHGWAGFRASMTFAALYSTAFLTERFSKLPLLVGLAMQAQMLAVSGWLLRSAYLRGLAAWLFLLPLAAAMESGNLYGPREQWWWHKPMLALAGLGMLNRLFLQGGAWYSFGAAVAATAFLIPMEPAVFRALAVTASAAAASMLLRWKSKPESAYVGSALAFISVGVLLAEMPDSWTALTLGFPALLYGARAMTLADGLPRLGAWSAMQLFLAVWLHKLLAPDTGWEMAAWAAMALAAFWAGGLLRSWTLAASAWVGELALVGVWLVRWVEKTDGVAPRALAVAALLAIHAGLSARRSEDWSQKGAAKLALWWHGAAGAGLLTWLVADAVSGRRLTLAWSIEAFVLLGAGFLLRSRQLRLAGLLLFGSCLLKLFLYDFSQLDMVSRIGSFLGLGLLLLATSWVYTRFKEQIRRYL